MSSSESVRVAAAQLRGLAELELAPVIELLDNWTAFQCATFLVETCRAMDFMHVAKEVWNSEEFESRPHDYAVAMRGWNVLLGQLLSRTGGFSGVPMAASTAESRRDVLSVLHVCGRHAILED